MRKRCCDVLSLGINYKALGSSKAAGEQSACKCDLVYFARSRCEQQPVARIRRVLHVMYLCNLSNSALTSNSLISFLCPKCSVTVSPTSVPVCRFWPQDCVCASVKRAFTVGCHSYFTFSRPQMLRCIFNIRKEWG